MAIQVAKIIGIKGRGGHLYTFTGSMLFCGYRPHLLIHFDEMLYCCLYEHTLPAKSAVGGVDLSAARRRRQQPMMRVEYVNISYHTTFHQNISINVACIHKRALVP